MAAAPHIELDSRSPEAVDGRQIRAVTFQDSRLEYVRGTLGTVDLPAPGSRAVVVGSGRGLLARGLAGLGFEVVAVDPSAAATEMAREADGGEHPGSTTAPRPPSDSASPTARSTSPTTRTPSRSLRSSTGCSRRPPGCCGPAGC